MTFYIALFFLDYDILYSSEDIVAMVSLYEQVSILCHNKRKKAQYKNLSKYILVQCHVYPSLEKYLKQGLMRK